MKGKANCTGAAWAMDVRERETSEVQIILRSQKANLILERERERGRKESRKSVLLQYTDYFRCIGKGDKIQYI